MTAFWFIAAVLLACAMAFVIVPLVRKPRSGARVTRDAINVSVYRDQVRELDADVRAGTMTAGRRDEALRDIESRILEDMGASPESRARLARPGRTAVAVGIAAPLLAISLYFIVGSPGALISDRPESLAQAHGFDAQQVEAMIAGLAARLKTDPNNANGWVMLARSYAALGRFSEASLAYANAIARIPNDAQLLADYADALAMAQGRRLDGEPERLVARALALDPNHVKARALAGSAAFARRDYKGALTHWEHILRVAPADSEFAQSVRASIEEARALAGQPGKPAVSAAPAAAAGLSASAPATPSVPARSGSISGTVRLAPGVANAVAPGDTVFVFARAAEGSRMPVAILRAQAKDLPLQFTLDDRASMMPGSKLSDQRLVMVGARVSRSGSATPQPGDVQGFSGPVAPGSSGLQIVLSDLAK